MPRSEFVDRKPQSNFKKTEFLKLSPGKHIVRFLSDKKLVYDTHYVRGTTFACPGDGCPVCKNNAQIKMEHPKDYYKTPGYVPVRQVGVTNVLDRTPAKICPDCQTAVKKSGTNFPTSCPNCNTSLVTTVAKPLDRVCVLSKGKAVFDQVEGFKKTVLDEETQNPIVYTTYDFTIIATADQKSTPVLDPMPDRNDVVEVPEDALFDLEKAVIQLNPEEVSELLRGVNVKDILKGRRIQNELAEEKPAVSDAYRQQMTNLFEEN